MKNPRRNIATPIDIKEFFKQRRTVSDFNIAAHEFAAEHFLGNESSTGFLEDVFTAGEPVSGTAALADGQTMVWDATNRLWKPGSVGGSGGGGMTTIEAAGIYYTHQFGARIGTYASYTVDRMTTAPFLASGSYDRIGIIVDTNVANASVRLGMYDTDAATGRPGALLNDFGLVTAATIGFHELTISVTYDQWVWLAYSPEVAAPRTAGLGLSASDPSMPFDVMNQDQTVIREASVAGFVSIVTAGALPDPCPAFDAVRQTTPMVMLRRA